MPSDPLTPAQARQLAGLLPDDLDALRDAIRAAGDAWVLYYREGGDVAAILAVVEGRCAGWCAFPATSAESAELMGRYLRAGLDIGTREVLDAAHDIAQAAIRRNRPH